MKHSDDCLSCRRQKDAERQARVELLKEQLIDLGGAVGLFAMLYVMGLLMWAAQ